VPFIIPVNSDDETLNYYLEFLFDDEFNDDLGTKLSTGNAFPHHPSSTFSGITVTLADKKTVHVTGTGYTNASSEVYGIWFAVEDPGVGGETADVKLYYTKTVDP